MTETKRWHPAPNDSSLIGAGQIFTKYGYVPYPKTIVFLKNLKVDGVLVRALQTATCCLAAGFALFDSGLQPTRIMDLTVGSSLDRSGGLAVRFWPHHFGHGVTSSQL